KLATDASRGLPHEHGKPYRERDREEREREAEVGQRDLRSDAAVSIRVAPVNTIMVHSTRNTRKTGSSSGSSGARTMPVAMGLSPRRKMPRAIPKRSHTSRNATPTTVTTVAAAGRCQKNSEKRQSS